MHTRTLGPQGPAVSAIGLGCMTTTGGYGATPDRAEMLAHVRSAVDLGVTFFDTAEIYGPHANEELVGEALRDVLADRDDVVIATKFAQHVDPATRTATGRMLRPDEVAAAADGSLQRLGVEAIDLYYQHRVNPEFPIEEFAGAVADLVAAGKVKHYGLSEAAADTIRRAHAVHPVTAVQSEYSLWWRRPEEAVLGVCAELGVGFVPFSPLGKGFLTGTIATGTSFAEGSDLRASIPASRRRPSSRTPPWWTSCGASPSGRAAHPARSPWPGCWPASRGSSPSPGPPTRGGSARTSPRPKSPSHPRRWRSCPGSRPPSRSRVAATRTGWRRRRTCDSVVTDADPDAGAGAVPGVRSRRRHRASPAPSPEVATTPGTPPHDRRR